MTRVVAVPANEQFPTNLLGKWPISLESHSIQACSCIEHCLWQSWVAPPSPDFGEIYSYSLVVVLPSHIVPHFLVTPGWIFAVLQQPEKFNSREKSLNLHPRNHHFMKKNFHVTTATTRPSLSCLLATMGQHVQK